MIKKVLVVSIFILIIISLIVVEEKISHFSCCSCPPSTYRLYPVSIALLENYFSAFIDCQCLSEGCSFSFFVVPIDLIILIAILFALFLWKSRKK